MLNKWIGVGRVEKDADCRQTRNNTAVTTFNVVTNVRIGYGPDAAYDRQTQKVVTFGKQAESCKVLKEGELVYVDGRVIHLPDSGRDEVRATVVHFLDQRPAMPVEEDFDEPPLCMRCYEEMARK